MNKYIKLLCFSLFALLISCDSNDDGINMVKSEFIPRKILFGNPDKINVRLSPDGKYMSYVAPLDGVLNIFIMDPNDLNSAKPVTFDKGRGITSYSWTYQPSRMIYSQDSDGDENSILYLLDLNNLTSKAITSKGVKSGVINASSRYHDEILIGMNERNPVYRDVYKLNLNDGTKSLVYQNNEYTDFVADDDNNLRFATKTLPNGDQQIDEFKDGKVNLFRTIAFEDTDQTGTVGMNKAGSKLFMIDSSNRDKTALYEIELNTNNKKLIAESDKADIAGLIADPNTYEIQGYSYEYDLPVTKIIDPAIKGDFEYLDTVSEGEINLISRTIKDDTWIVAFSRPDAPVAYYKYDRVNKKADFLFTQNSALEKLDLNPLYPTVIKTRDGLDLVSYISIPKKYVIDGKTLATSEPLPLILYVHGGPTARDSWGYNSVHQWLTDRGFAVLSVNYRGSTGFGKEFIRAGDGEWSGKMHDDLIDAVNWAIDKGITTKDKVGIFGGSYGGYAVLVGLTMTPDVFACGVDIVGPSNLKTLYDSIPPYWEPFKATLKRRFGADPETKEGLELLAKISPVNFAGSITKPLLIAQGANDPRVKQAESDQIFNMMLEKNIPVTYLLYPNEGHGFARPENKASFYAMAEQFLGECFNIPTQEVGNDLEGSSMQIIKDKVLVEVPINSDN